MMASYSWFSMMIHQTWRVATGVEDGRGLGVAVRWEDLTEGLADWAVPVDVVGLAKVAALPTPTLEVRPAPPSGMTDGTEPLDRLTASTTTTDPMALSVIASFHPGVRGLRSTASLSRSA